MSTEPLTLKASGNTSAVADAPAANVDGKAGPRTGLKFDQRYLAPLFITLILLVAHFVYGALKSPLHTGAAIATAILVEAALGWYLTGRVPHLASAYVSGISAGILVRTEAIWPFVLTAAIAIASKYVLRWKGRHLWNPTNFAISAMLVLAHGQMATLGAEFDNKLLPFAVVAIVGCFIVSRVKRLHMSVIYVGSFVLFAWVRSMINGHPFLAEVAPITGPMYMLFTFFMITDPKTTVTSFRGQCLVAFLVAAAECALRLDQNVHAAYYALFFVGPIANITEIWWKERTARRSASASAVPAATG